MDQHEPGATESPDKPAASADVIAISTARKQTEEAATQARLEGARAERERCEKIRGLARIVRMPAARAEALAAKLIAEGVSAEDAQSAFIEAQASAEALAAGTTEILGHTAAVTQAALASPPMKPREAVMAEKARAMSRGAQFLAAASAEEKGGTFA